MPRSKKPKPAPLPKRARDQSLPGLEDRVVAPLETLLADVADAREQRATLLRREDQLLQQTLVLMDKLGKQRYAHDGVEVRVVPGEKLVRIRFHKPRPRKGKRHLDQAVD